MSGVQLFERLHANGDNPRARILYVVCGKCELFDQLGSWTARDVLTGLLPVQSAQPGIDIDYFGLDSHRLRKSAHGLWCRIAEVRDKRLS